MHKMHNLFARSACRLRLHVDGCKDGGSDNRGLDMLIELNSAITKDMRPRS